MADIVGAHEDQIRRQGRWNNTTLNIGYLTRLSREIMRSMAGFPINGRFFYNAHAVLDPSTSLRKKLFPAINERHDRLASKKLSPEKNNPIQPTLAFNAFAQVIMMLRKTFIQDSMPMIKFRPCHPIWQLPIFSDPAYFPFKRNSSS